MVENIRKNDMFEIVIEDMGNEGEGIGRYNGYTLFVKGALKGEKVLVKVMKTGKSYGYARLEKIIEPAVFRCEPQCPVFSPCGGCSLLHMTYEAQLEYKENKVKNCLSRIGKVENIEQIMEPIIGMENPFYYRNKVQFPVGYDKNDEIVAGFYANRTHSIIVNDHCLIQNQVNEDIIKTVIKWMKDNKVTAYNEKALKGCVRHIMTRTGHVTGQIMTVIVVNEKLGKAKKEALVEALAGTDGIKGMTSIGISVNSKNTNVIMGDSVETIFGPKYIEDYIGDVKFQISALSFYQVNPVQTKKLYDTALEFAALSGNETVWDLYCGIGTISLFLAKKAKKVYGVEIVERAIEDAKNNARINGIENAEFFAGSAGDVASSTLVKNEPADVVVVDPPRKGCDLELIETIASISPKRVVYVSCDPATLARDVAEFAKYGYKLTRARCTDMFPGVFHVETVCLLSKK